jgi:hypothetical protein
LTRKNQTLAREHLKETRSIGMGYTEIRGISRDDKIDEFAEEAQEKDSE